MKYKILIIVSVIIIILITLGLTTSYIDSARVRNSIEPKYTIKIVDKNKITYWGLGYKIIRYPSTSPNEPYQNNIGVKYGSWFMKYEINKNNHNESTYNISKIENVNINISDITATGATITIQDTNINPSIYGEWYKIEKHIDGKWYTLKTLTDDSYWISIGYTVNESNEVKFEINWEEIYGKLPLGNYRIIKESHKKYIAVEFSIKNN